MKPNFLFDLLFPGDEKLKVPCFSCCDHSSFINYFLSSLPENFCKELEKVSSENNDPAKIVKELGADSKPTIDDAISFYFSRPKVVLNLTGRPVPLTSSGMAKY